MSKYPEGYTPPVGPSEAQLESLLRRQQRNDALSIAGVVGSAVSGLLTLFSAANNWDSVVLYSVPALIVFSIIFFAAYHASSRLSREIKKLVKL